MNVKLFLKGLILLVCIVKLSTSIGFAQEACEGNFDCDQDVDGTDAAVFKEDFGRSAFANPCDNCYTCPPCIVCEPCDACSCWTTPAPVPKTGQTSSLVTGDDGDLEMGVAWPNPRFTDNGDGTITDNLTGLIWLKNANCFGTGIWNNALSNCNGLSSGNCGLTDGSQLGDWRVPNRRELFSLIDDENFISPVLPSGHPFSNVELAFYWSSTLDLSWPTYAWGVDIYSGSVVKKLRSSDDFYVWCVKGGF